MALAILRNHLSSPDLTTHLILPCSLLSPTFRFRIALIYCRVPYSHGFPLIPSARESCVSSVSKSAFAFRRLGLFCVTSGFFWFPRHIDSYCVIETIQLVCFVVPSLTNVNFMYPPDEIVVVEPCVPVAQLFEQVIAPVSRAFPLPSVAFNVEDPLLSV